MRPQEGEPFYEGSTGEMARKRGENEGQEKRREETEAYRSFRTFYSMEHPSSESTGVLNVHDMHEDCTGEACLQLLA
jgi:hypothetical protein